MTSIKVGDVVAWAMVPMNALVRLTEGGMTVKRRIARRMWEWHLNPTIEKDEVTVLALDVPDKDLTRSDLRRLAEVFEVREALGTMRAADHVTERALEDAIKAAAAGPTMSDLFAAMTTVAERLHAAGWRPGMTAEDAARLLSEAQS